MLLKLHVSKLEDVSEDFRGLYEPDGDKFKLKVMIEDFVHKDQVAEFRTNNINLKKQNEELLAKIDEIKGEAGKEVEELVSKRVATYKGETSKQLEELTTALKSKEALVSNLLIDNKVKEAALKSGVRATALDDVILRAKQTFTLEGEAVVAKQNGETVYGADTKPLDINGWMKQLTTQAPHLFETSVGAGAMGSKVTGGQPDMGNMSAHERIVAGLKMVGRTAASQQ